MQSLDHPRTTPRARPARHLLAVAALATFAFAAGAAAPAAAQACEDPKVLKFSIIPTQESIRELTLYKPVMDLLSKNTGKKIEFYMPTSYSSVVEALMGKWVDVAVLGPESYVIAHNKDATIEVFATYYKSKVGVQEAGPGYKSLLITKKGSKFTTIDSLKGSVMLLVDPASTSGALIPEAVFAKKVINVPLNQYFSKVAFSGGHDLSMPMTDDFNAPKSDTVSVGSSMAFSACTRPLTSSVSKNVLPPTS